MWTSETIAVVLWAINITKSLALHLILSILCDELLPVSLTLLSNTWFIDFLFFCVLHKQRVDVVTNHHRRSVCTRSGSISITCAICLMLIDLRVVLNYGHRLLFGLIFKDLLHELIVLLLTWDLHHCGHILPLWFCQRRCKCNKVRVIWIHTNAI